MYIFLFSIIHQSYEITENLDLFIEFCDPITLELGILIEF